MIAVMQNLPELIGGLAVVILTWLVRGWTIHLPFIGMKKYRSIK